MINFDLDNCLRFVNNKYELILLAKTRAIELLSGDSQPLVQKNPNEKSFFTALKEIEGGLHDYYSLNEKFMTSLKNEIAGTLVNNDDISTKEKDKFDDNSLFAQIFQSLGLEPKQDNSADNASDIFNEMIESSETTDNLNEDENDGFSSVEPEDLDEEEI